MEREFWLDAWDRGQIGFHRGDVNPRLVAHADVLPASGRIFVPLCGKSRDLSWLRERGNEVVGAELSQVAVEAFFAQQGWTPAIAESGDLVAYRAEGVTIFLGDFFALRREHLGEVAGFYDRAALVALPPELRVRYAQRMGELMGERARGLLVGFEYPPGQMSGPPFTLLEADVRALYEPAFSVEPLAEYDILEEEPRFRERGLTSLRERVYAIGR